ncbi:PX-associated-domain-containing protein [Coniochaeta sp. 2T2.1]|nr:PX-associated-domain-containing protein [Coniochaeta sp. 2T2.1]
MPEVVIPRRSSSVKAAAGPASQQTTSKPHGGSGTGPADSNPAAAAAEDQRGPEERLSPPQLHALFDILTHYQTYAEVESFKHPSTIAHYGRPFTLINPDSNSSDTSDPKRYASESSAPILASFLKSVILPLPGVRDLSSDFWSVRLQGILGKLAEAELSESYDKGAVGTRKTLATVASVIQEITARGTLGGCPKGDRRDLHRSYDTSSAEDLSQAWEDAVHELVYGDLVDELFDCAIKHDSLEHHSPTIKAVSDYVILHLGTFMHHVFVLSSEGQYLLKLVQNVHQLVPYSMIKQTLRIGNAATMINGMVKLLLAKLSVGAFSNWVGLTQNADDGVNLLQSPCRIITLVLSWDSSDFRKSAERIEKAKDGPPKEHLSAIKQYIEASSREEHDSMRALSQEKSQSIIVTIFQNSRPDLLSSLSEAQHTQCLEYYSALLSIRDREQITKVLCRQNPDLYTQSLRDAVESFEPIIRAIHEKVDIREHLAAMESFLNDFINTSRPKREKSGGKKASSVPYTPSVEDYVRLLQRNKRLLYNWLHQFAANCPEIRELCRTWAKEAITHFRQGKNIGDNGVQTTDQNKSADSGGDRASAAGDMSSAFQRIYTSLPAQTKQDVLRVLDAHAKYLDDLEHLSITRMQRVIDNMTLPDNPPTSKSGTTTPQLFIPTTASTPASGTNTPRQVSSMNGPGMFLCRWQELLDRTIVTPATPEGRPRTGKEVKANTALGKTGAGGAKENWQTRFLAFEAEKDVPSPPEADAVMRAFGPGFKAVLIEVNKRLQ